MAGDVTPRLWGMSNIWTMPHSMAYCGKYKPKFTKIYATTLLLWFGVGGFRAALKRAACRF